MGQRSVPLREMERGSPPEATGALPDPQGDPSHGVIGYNPSQWGTTLPPRLHNTVFTWGLDFPRLSAFFQTLMIEKHTIDIQTCKVYPSPRGSWDQHNKSNIFAVTLRMKFYILHYSNCPSFYNGKYTFSATVTNVSPADCNDSRSILFLQTAQNFFFCCIRVMCLTVSKEYHRVDPR